MATSNRSLAGIKNQDFDVVIIGGGISGAWLALHCAQYGYKTALIEKHDYASQTSSASSKLLHGGIRYLQQMQFNKVRESALERAHYLYAAPHLSAAIPFVVPTYRDLQRSKFFLNCGMAAYKLLCLGENRIIESAEQALPPIYSISTTELNAICDLDNQDHTGAVVFYERHMQNSERMVLAILQTAKDAGAQVHNYVSAESYILNDSVVGGVTAKDKLTGETFELTGKLVINAAGPWIGELNATLARAKDAPSISGFAVGSHIITRQLCDHAIAITTQHQSDTKVDRGGRHVFIIPWRGYSLIGTSYNEIDTPNGDIRLKPDHVAQLIDAVNQGMPSANLTHHDLVSGYSGLYPLQTDNIKKTVYQGSGEYQIIDHAQSNGLEGVVTALGAKFTTGRKLSELTMKLVATKLGDQYFRPTKTKLKGSDYSSLSDLVRIKTKQYKDRFSTQTIQHLIEQYGSDIDTFIASLDQQPELDNQICQHQPDILGQVTWAIDEEQAVTLNDVLFNRTSLGLLGIDGEGVDKVAQLMAQLLSWTEEETAKQIKTVKDRLADTKTALNN